MTLRTASSTYVCNWALDDTCCPKLAQAFTDLPDMAQRCVDQAAEILYALSGRQFGLCEYTARPCRLDECGPCDMRGFRWTPLLSGGQWTNVSCGVGVCNRGCSCTRVCEVWLPGPIDSITQVKLDGVVLGPSSYRVDNRRTLVRLNNECWPLCQDMNLDDTQDNTWSVTYSKGQPLPEAGVAALSALACELCKACIGDASCCLPARVTQLTRQGITMALLDPMEFLSMGRTGIYAVDLWLLAVNPKARSRGAGVFSPDVPDIRVTTWP